QQRLVGHNAFVENRLSTHFIEDHLPELSGTQAHSDDADLMLIAFSVFHHRQNHSPKNVWEEIGYWRVYPQLSFLVNGRKTEVVVEWKNEKSLSIKPAKQVLDIHLTKSGENVFELQVGDLVYIGTVSTNEVGKCYISFQGKTYLVDREDNLET